MLLCRDADGLRAPCPGNIAQRFGHQAAAQPAAAVCSIDQHAADRGFGVGDPRRDDPQEGHYAAAVLHPHEYALRVNGVGIGFRDVLFEEEDGLACLHDTVVFPGGEFAEMFCEDRIHGGL